MKDKETFDPALLATGHEEDTASAETSPDDEGIDETPQESASDGRQTQASEPEAKAERDSEGQTDAGVAGYEDLAIDAKAIGFGALRERLKSRPAEVKLVLLLGYPTAGKTWFLQRLKWIHRTHKLSPWDRKVVVPEHIWEGRALERTDDPASHLFDSQPINSRGQPDPKRSRRTFVIADLPGELFDRTRVPGGFVHVYEREEVTSLLALADALIMMLPAEEVLSRSLEAADDGQVPTERLPELQAAIETARRSSGAKGISKQERAARKAALAAAEDEYASMALLRLKQCLQDFTKLGGLVKADPKRRDKPLPVFVALSRADQAVSDVTPYDKDPWDALFAAQPELADHLQKDYLWSRVDFVTAFENQARGDAVVRYSKHRHFGVDAVLDWIDWATERTLPTARLSLLGVTRALRLTRQVWANEQRGRGHG